MLQVLERSLTQKTGRDLARNCCEALARAKDPAAIPSLLRAAMSSEETVSEMAVQALGACKAREACEELWGGFGSLPMLSQRSLVQASAGALGPDAAPHFAAVLAERRLAWLWEGVVMESEVLPPEAIKRALLPAFPSLTQPARFRAACVLHVTGEQAATDEVLSALKEKDPRVRVAAVQALGKKDLEKYLDRGVLSLLEDPDPGVQEAVVEAIRSVPGENIDNHLEIKVFSPYPGVRKAALRAYRDRGLRAHMERLLSDLKEKTGTAFRQAVEDLVAAGEPRAIPLLASRLRQIHGPDRRVLLQGIAYLRHPDGIQPLLEAFLGEDEPLGNEPELRSVSNTAVLLTNIEESEPVLRDLFMTRLRGDPIRRAHLLSTLANMAGTTQDGARKRRIHDFLLRVAMDRSRIAQERLLALEFLRSSITLDEAMQLKRQLPEENEAMRPLPNNWLWEFFGPPPT